MAFSSFKQFRKNNRCSQWHILSVCKLPVWNTLYFGLHKQWLWVAELFLKRHTGCNFEVERLCRRCHDFLLYLQLGLSVQRALPLAWVPSAAVATAGRRGHLVPSFLSAMRTPLSPVPPPPLEQFGASGRCGCRADSGCHCGRPRSLNQFSCLAPPRRHASSGNPWNPSPHPAMVSFAQAQVLSIMLSTKPAGHRRHQPAAEFGNHSWHSCCIQAQQDLVFLGRVRFFSLPCIFVLVHGLCLGAGVRFVSG
jgi:hypothetical protein